MISAAPCSVSSDFGQLVVMRHLSSGIDCAMAGAAMLAAPTALKPVTLIKSRRFIEFPSPLELRFRSSQTAAATSDANFGIKGALANLEFSGAAFHLKFLNGIAASTAGTSNGWRR